MPFPSPALASREGAVVAWLEAERRPVVSVQDVADVFPWSRVAIRDVLSHRVQPLAAQIGWTH